MTLLGKIKILTKILLIKWRILKLIWVVKPIELTENSRALFDNVQWDYLGDIRYKRGIDPTGDYRFYVPDISQDCVWRIDTDYSVKGRHKLPMTLELIATKDGLKYDKT